MDFQKSIRSWIFPSLLALFLGVFFFQSIAHLNYPYELDYGEGCSMVFLSQLKSQGTYFFDINNYPFSYATYPPLFFLLAWLVNMFVPSLLLSMRLLAFFSACGVTVLLFLIICDRFRDKVLALFFSCMFLSVWFVKPWALLARVDMTACFLGLLGLYIFLAQIKTPKRYWAFFFLALAFFVKQNAVFPVCSILLYALIRKDQRRYFFPYLGTYGILVFAGWGALSSYTAGESLKHLFFYTAERSFSFTTFIQCFSDFTMTLLFVVLWAVPYRFFSRVMKSEDLILWLYLGFNFWGLALAGFTAASHNYLIEPVIALLLFAAMISTYWIENSVFGSRSVRFLIVLFMIFGQIVWMQIYAEKNLTALGRHFLSALPLELRKMDEEVLEEMIRNHEGAVLSENLTLLVKNNQPVLLGCSYPMAEQGLWEPQELIRKCQEGQPEIIIAGSRIRMMKELFKTIEENYKYFRRLSGYDVYRSLKRQQGGV